MTAANSALTVAANVLNAVAAVLGALVVRRTTERQEARWRRLAGSSPTGGGGATWTTA